MELFGDILAKSLRRSDVYTKYGRSRYLVILAEMEHNAGEMVLNRIRKKWRTVEKGKGAEISWDIAVITDHENQKRPNRK